MGSYSHPGALETPYSVPRESIPMTGRAILWSLLIWAQNLTQNHVNYKTFYPNQSESKFNKSRFEPTPRG